MKVGTKSLLFGSHQFILHPIMVAIAWYKLYGFSRVYCKTSGVSTYLLSPKLWVTFFLHDIGYWGCSNMDGIQGKNHPSLGASILLKLLGSKWSKFCFLHSRSIASRFKCKVSLLCAPDKLAFAVCPKWLYILLASLSGEIHEYMKHANSEAGRKVGLVITSKGEWYDSVKTYLLSVVDNITWWEDPGVPPEDAQEEMERD